MPQLEEKLQQGTVKANDTVRKHLFDIVAGCIVIALIIASLDIFRPRPIEDVLKDLISVGVEWVIFFLASVMLNDNRYKKGAFVGKQSNNYVNTAKEYSQIVNLLSGKELDKLPIFCDNYNSQALELLQKELLRKACISFEVFNSGDEPLKTLSNKLIKERYGNEIGSIIIKAKNCKIKGIKATQLTSGINSQDITEIGDDERQLAKKYNRTSTLILLISTVLLAFIAIRDLTTWGWSSLLVVTFKTIYAFAKSYMAYFNAYNDVTIDVVKHINRKIDILKQFKAWYNTLPNENEK